MSKDAMVESEYPDIRSLDLFAAMDEAHFEALMRGEGTNEER